MPYSAPALLRLRTTMPPSPATPVATSIRLAGSGVDTTGALVNVALNAASGGYPAAVNVSGADGSVEKNSAPSV